MRRDAKTCVIDDFGDDDGYNDKVSALNKLVYMDHKDLTIVEIDNMMDAISGNPLNHSMYMDIDPETMELYVIIDIHPLSSRQDSPMIRTHDVDSIVEFINELSMGDKVRKELTLCLLAVGKSIVFPIKIPLDVFFHLESTMGL